MLIRSPQHWVKAIVLVKMGARTVQSLSSYKVSSGDDIKSTKSKFTSVKHKVEAPLVKEQPWKKLPPIRTDTPCPLHPFQKGELIVYYGHSG